jgi:hypothetical protein
MSCPPALPGCRAWPAKVARFHISPVAESRRSFLRFENNGRSIYNQNTYFEAFGSCLGREMRPSSEKSVLIRFESPDFKFLPSQKGGDLFYGSNTMSVQCSTRIHIFRPLEASWAEICVRPLRICPHSFSSRPMSHFSRPGAKALCPLLSTQ